MARGVRAERNYTGKALQTYEKIQKLESELKVLRENLKIEYREQLKAEKEAAKLENENQKKELIKMIQKSGKSLDEIKAFLES